MNVDTVAHSSRFAGVRRALVVAAGSLVPHLSLLTGWAEVGTADDKSRYNLFHPTPPDQMREFSPDRPDKTESPYTVDAGHWQIEMDFLAYNRDHDTAGGANVLRQEYAVVPVNLKVGLLNQVDLQLLLAPFVHAGTQDRVTGGVSEQNGFGGVVLRTKVNVWGDDAGRTALAVMPFVQFPTGSDNLGSDTFAGGLIVPLAVGLPAGWKMGVMTEFDFNENANAQGRHTEFINSVTFGHDLYGQLAGYVEFFSRVSDETGADWVGTVDVGLTYALNADAQLDMGVNLGVTEAADDLNLFFGLTLRF